MFNQWLRDLRFNTQYIFESAFVDKDYKDFKYYCYKLWDDCLIHPIRWNWYGIQKLFKWFKTIYTDRDWDHYHLTKIQLTKLTNMRDHIAKCQNHTEWKRDVKSLNFCIKRLEELIESDFCKKLRDKHEEKYGKTRMFSFPASEDENGKILTYECKFLKTKVNPRDEELVEEERKDFIKIMNIERRREERCYRLLYSTMAKYHAYWWD